jgi:hypothetical protein
MDVIVGVVVGVVLLIAARNILRIQSGDRKRAADLKTIAPSLGLTFEGGYASLRSRFGEFQEFTSPYGNAGQNIMTGHSHGQPVTVMDCVHGGGGPGSFRYKTVAVFSEGARGLPDFRLQSGAISAIMRRLIESRVEITGHEAFSSHYVLRGADHAAIARTFDASVAEFLGAHPGWDVETRDGAATVSRGTQLLPPDQLEQFLAESVDLLDRLRAGSAP